jgi:hypothetical protein
VLAGEVVAVGAAAVVVGLVAVLVVFALVVLDALVDAVEEVVLDVFVREPELVVG